MKEAGRHINTTPIILMHKVNISPQPSNKNTTSNTHTHPSTNHSTSFITLLRFYQ